MIEENDAVFSLAMSFRERLLVNFVSVKDSIGAFLDGVSSSGPSSSSQKFSSTTRSSFIAS